MTASGSAEIALLPSLPWPRRLSLTERVSLVVREAGKPEDFAPAPAR